MPSMQPHKKRKRLSILRCYPITAAVVLFGVLLFVLFYSGGGASALRGLPVEDGQAASPSSVMTAMAAPQPSPTPGAAAKDVDITGRLFPYEEGGLWGYKNAKGDVVIQPQFLRALDFLQGQYAFAAVEQGGALLYGLVSRSGVWAAEPQWNEVRPYSEGLAAVCQDEKWGYIDTAGKIVIPCAYRETGDFANGRAAVRPIPRSAISMRTGIWRSPRSLRKQARSAAIWRLSAEKASGISSIKSAPRSRRSRMSGEPPIRRISPR